MYNSRCIITKFIGLYEKVTRELAQVRNGRANEFFFCILDIYTVRRSHSNATSAAKGFAKVGLWQFTKSCTWRSRRTSARYAAGASIRGAT